MRKLVPVLSVIFLMTTLFACKKDTFTPPYMNGTFTPPYLNGGFTPPYLNGNGELKDNAVVADSTKNRDF